jgi:hypothetical protein
MWRGLVLSIAMAAMAALMLGAPALAGGWAITTIDSLPPGEFQAGETYRLGYMIRQHGRTPYAGAEPAIRIRSDSGETYVFPGAPEGAPGHYISEVRFPGGGEWTWEVDQSPFGPQKLGTVTVLPAAATVGAPARAAIVGEPATQAAMPEALHTDGPLAGLPVALLLAAILAIGLVAWRLVTLMRRAHVPVPRHPTERARAS